VLRALGHHLGVQGRVRKKDHTPDYAFFPDQESLNQADAALGQLIMMTSLQQKTI
jgi:hypothetical protein